MAQSDARFGYQSKLSREDHDLSQWLGATAAPGMLLPIWYDYASPGDSYYMEHNLPLLRSTTLAAPAMVDVKVHFDTFFVPMQMIYQPFENTMFSLKNLQSSNYLMDALRNNAFPLLNYADFVQSVKDYGQDTSVRCDAFRLADLLDLKPENFLTSVESPSTSPKALNALTQYMPNFFPYQICAYHTIFQYFYRLDDKTQFENRFCNLDKWYSNSTIVLGPEFFKIHQRPWDFDYFTSLYRSPIVSNANMQNILPRGVYSDLSDSDIIPSDKSGVIPVSENNDINLFTGYQNSTALLRQLFANEKLAMITGRTKKNYDSQVLAHYGVKVPHDIKHDITLIHSDTYDLNVQEVTNLANTSDSPLGELAGKSYATGNGKQFKFEAPCHGVVMTIFSIEPKKRYYGTFSKLNAVTDAFDFPTPEFDRLGNMPMFRYEIGSMPSSSYSMTDIVGWKERYYAFKRKYDKTTLAFGADIAGVHINNYSPYMLAFRPFGRYIANAGGGPNTSARPDMEERFYIERNAVDALSLVPFYNLWKEESAGEDWSVTPWLLYARDPFIVNSHITCKKVSWLSKDGEPIYPW